MMVRPLREGDFDTCEDIGRLVHFRKELG